MMIRNQEKGLTLIEMIVVLSIITLMAGLVVPLIDNFRIYDGMRREKSQMSELQSSVNSWMKDQLLRTNADVTPADLNFSMGALDPNNCLMPAPVLEAQPGRAYLTHWFEDQIIVPNTGKYLLADMWGKSLKFPKEFTPASSTILSFGPDMTEMQNLDNVKFNLDATPLIQQRNEAQLAVINAMLSRYNQTYPIAGITDPAYLAPHLLSSATSTQVLNALKAAGLINNDAYWQGFTMENFVSATK